MGIQASGAPTLPRPPVLVGASLIQLNLSGTGLADDDVEALTTFSYLMQVSLDRTKLTDAGVPTLAKIPGLGELSLRNAHITDASIPMLESMSLRFLDLRGTKVT